MKKIKTKYALTRSYKSHTADVMKTHIVSTYDSAPKAVKWLRDNLAEFTNTLPTDKGWVQGTDQDEIIYESKRSGDIFKIAPVRTPKGEKVKIHRK